MLPSNPIKLVKVINLSVAIALYAAFENAVAVIDDELNNCLNSSSNNCITSCEIVEGKFTEDMFCGCVPWHNGEYVKCVAITFTKGETHYIQWTGWVEREAHLAILYKLQAPTLIIAHHKFISKLFNEMDFPTK